MPETDAGRRAHAETEDARVTGRDAAGLYVGEVTG